MDNQTVKQDLYQAVSEFTKLEPTADNDTISTLYTRIKVFADELPVYPSPQTQAEIDAYDLAHGQSESDLLYFSPESTVAKTVDERATVLGRLQTRATQIEQMLRTDPASSD